jgi:hypothetical protein
MNRTGFPINETEKNAIFIHPCPAFAMLAIFQHTPIRAELTLNCLNH